MMRLQRNQLVPRFSGEYRILYNPSTFWQSPENADALDKVHLMTVPVPADKTHPLKKAFFRFKELYAHVWQIQDNLLMVKTSQHPAERQKESSLVTAVLDLLGVKPDSVKRVEQEILEGRVSKNGVVNAYPEFQYFPPEMLFLHGEDLAKKIKGLISDSSYTDEQLGKLFEVHPAIGSITQKDLNTILVSLSHKGKTGVFKKLHQLGYDLGYKTSLNTNLAYITLSQKHLETAKYLDSIGIDVDQYRDDSKLALLQIVSSSGYLDAVKWLHEVKKFPLDIRRELNSFTPVLAAAHYGQLDVLKYLYKQGADFNVALPDGTNVVFQAVGKADNNDAVAVLNFLYDMNVEIDFLKQNDLGDTPLHVAAKNNRLDVLQFYLEKGCDLNVKNNFGKTPFDYLDREQLTSDEVEQLSNIESGARAKNESR